MRLTHTLLRPRSGRSAFTLVELLVVIGIIALLISILLPSLNRARELAKSIKCSANLHSIGQALQIYLQDNKGMLPIGWWDGIHNPHGTDFSPAKPYTNWGLELLNAINGKSGANTTDVAYAKATSSTNVQMFQCPSVNMAPPAKQFGIVNHYAAHPRLFPCFNSSSPAQALDAANKNAKWDTMRASRVKRAAEILTIFDGSLVYDAATETQDAQYTIPVANSIDNYNLYPYGSGDRTYLTDNYSFSASMKNTDPITLQLYSTADSDVNTDNAANHNNVRFRHVGNKIMNGLMFDGHVEGFHCNQKAKTCDILRLNINTSY